MAYNNGYNVIDISKDSFRPKKYFCNHCNRSLFLKDKDTQEYVCTNCNIVYYPNNQLVKKTNRFEVPDGSDPN
jgi:ribosomal protein S27AE